MTEPESPACAREIAKVADPSGRSARLSVLPPQRHHTLVGFLLKNVLLPIRQHFPVGMPGNWDLAAQTCRPLASPRLSPGLWGSATVLLLKQFTHRMRGIPSVVVGNSTSQPVLSLSSGLG